MSYTKFSRWLDDVQDEEAGYYDNSEDDVASYLLNLTNLDHVVDRADAVLDRAEDKLAAWTPWAHEKYEGAAEATGAAARRFRAFALLLVTSLVMFGLAFTLGLPILVIRPQKFALAFTTGSIFFCTALAVVRGVGPFLRSFLTSRRLPYALAYALTLVLTLWAACLRRSYILTVVFASMQIGFWCWSALMHMPGGGRGALRRFVLRKVCRLAWTVGRPCATCRWKVLFWETSQFCSKASDLERAVVGPRREAAAGEDGHALDDVRVAGERREAPSR